MSAQRDAAIRRALEDADDARRIIARQAGQLGGTNPADAVKADRVDLFVRALDRLGWTIEPKDRAR